MRPLAVIPARAGSKRLARKNLRPLGGRPMLAYTVEAALGSGLFDRVWVSTEDPEIARVAAAHGAMIHARPAELAGDLVSATDVCLELLDARARAGDPYDAVVCLQPTSPLRTAADLRDAWRRFVDEEADFLVSVTPIDPHYYHWAVQRTGDEWALVFGERYMIERPLLPPVFRPNGAIKIARAAPLRERRHFFGPRLAVHEMPEERSVHVAVEADWLLAAALLARDGRAASAAGAPADAPADLERSLV